MAPPCSRPQPPSPSPKNTVVRPSIWVEHISMFRLCDAHVAYTTFHVTFLSMTHHVRTYILGENRSLIQSLALMRSAIILLRDCYYLPISIQVGCYHIPGSLVNFSIYVIALSPRGPSKILRFSSSVLSVTPSFCWWHEQAGKMIVLLCYVQSINLT